MKTTHRQSQPYAPDTTSAHAVRRLGGQQEGASIATPITRPVPRPVWGRWEANKKPLFHRREVFRKGNAAVAPADRLEARYDAQVLQATASALAAQDAWAGLIVSDGQENIARVMLAATSTRTSAEEELSAGPSNQKPTEQS